MTAHLRDQISKTSHPEQWLALLRTSKLTQTQQSKLIWSMVADYNFPVGPQPEAAAQALTQHLSPDALKTIGKALDKLFFHLKTPGAIAIVMDALAQLDPKALRAMAAHLGYNGYHARLALWRAGKLQKVSDDILRHAVEAWLDAQDPACWGHAEAAMAPAEQWQRLTIELASKKTVCNWAHLDQALAGASDGDFVAIMRTQTNRQAIFERLTPAHIPAIERWLQSIPPPSNNTHTHRHNTNLVLATMALLAKEGSPIPEPLDAHLKHALCNDERDDGASVIAQIAKGLSAERIHPLLKTGMQKGHGLAWRVCAATQDTDFIEETLASAGKDKKLPVEAAARGMALAPALTAPLLKDALTQNDAPQVAAMAARALRWIDDPTNDPALVAALSHKSKKVRLLAARSIAQLGPRLLPLLIDALKTSSKSTRQAAVTAIADMDAPEQRAEFMAQHLPSIKHSDTHKALASLPARPNPMTRAQHAVDALDDARRHAIAGIWHAMTFSNNHLENLKTQDHTFWALGLPLLRADSGPKHGLETWNQWAQGHGPKALQAWMLVYEYTHGGDKHISIDWLGEQRWEPLRAMAMTATKRPPVIQYLAINAPQEHAPFFVDLLEDPSAGVRNAAAEALVTIDDPPVAHILERFASADNNARIVIAGVLQKLAPAQGVKPLQDALKTAKNAKLKTALQAALRECTAQAAIVRQTQAAATPPASDPNAATTQAIQQEAPKDVLEHLQSLPKHDPQAFLKGAQLPQIHTKDGRPLNKDALGGLLGLLQREGPGRHLTSTRNLTNQLNPNDLIDLGLAIYEAWKHADTKDEAHLWGLFQLSHTGGPEAFLDFWLDRYTLSPLTPHRLTVLACHKSPIARTFLHMYEARFEAIDTRRMSRQDTKTVENTRKSLRKRRNKWSKGRSIAALEAEGIVRPTFGYGLHALSARGIDTIWYGWKDDSSWQWSEQHHTFRLNAKTQSSDTLAQPQQSIELFFEHASRADGEPIENHDARKRLKRLQEHQQYVNQNVQKAAQELEERGARVCWTHTDWHRQMCVHPMWRRFARGLLFHQPDGPVFGVNPALEPVDVHGNPVTVDKSRFILRATAKDLSPQDHQSWAKRMAQWREAWDAQTPKPVRFGVEDHNASDKLAELRQLLYNPPTSNHWRQVRTVFDAIKDDPLGMDSAIEYARPLLDTSWGDVLRFPPEDWVRGQHFDTGKDPRLVLCNAIAATEVYTSNGSVALGTMANTADFNHIQWLMIGSSNCTRDSFKIMGRKGFMPSVTKFILSPCIGSTPAWTRFCKSPLMQRLDTLIIHQGLNADQFQPIIDSGLLGNLRHLEIAGVNHTQAKAIIAGLDPKKLRCLGFDGAFNAKTARLVALENEQLSSLEALKTGKISKKSRDILCGSPYLSQQALSELLE